MTISVRRINEFGTKRVNWSTGLYRFICSGNTIIILISSCHSSEVFYLSFLAYVVPCYHHKKNQFIMSLKSIVWVQTTPIEGENKYIGP